MIGDFMARQTSYTNAKPHVLKVILYHSSKALQTKLENLEYVKEYYGYSNEKAKSALTILRDEHIKVIKKKLFKGGR